MHPLLMEQSEGPKVISYLKEKELINDTQWDLIHQEDIGRKYRLKFQHRTIRQLPDSQLTVDISRARLLQILAA